MNIGIYLQPSASKWNEIYLLDQQRWRPREIPDFQNVSRVIVDDSFADTITFSAQLMRSYWWPLQTLLMSQKLFSFHHIVPSRHCWTGPRGPHPGWGCACAAPAPASASTVPASARCGAAAPCSGWTPSPPPSQTGGLQQTILFGEGRVQADWWDEW